MPDDTMDPNDFLDGIFVMAGHHNLARHIEETLEPVSESSLPPKGQEAFAKSDEAQERPVAYRPDTGLVVVSTFKEDSDKDFEFRMVCWAEMGEAQFTEYACTWWAENNPAMN